MRPEEATSDHECEFGKWYYGEGQVLSDHTYLTEVFNYHTKVHQHAKLIADSIKQGNSSRASELIQEFEKVRENFFKALDEEYLR
ncbi:MAG: CZB domain-containing protein [Desulfobulbus sp.]